MSLLTSVSAYICRCCVFPVKCHGKLNTKHLARMDGLLPSEKFMFSFSTDTCKDLYFQADSRLLLKEILSRSNQSKPPRVLQGFTSPSTESKPASCLVWGAKPLLWLDSMNAVCLEKRSQWNLPIHHKTAPWTSDRSINRISSFILM